MEQRGRETFFSQTFSEIWHPVLEIAMWENLIPQVTPVAFMWQLAFLRLYWLQIRMEEPKTGLCLNFFMPVESEMKDMCAPTFCLIVASEGK